MILYWALFALICFFAIKDWRKSVIIWFPLRLLFNECVCLKYSSPAISLTLAVDILFILLYCFNKDKRVQNNNYYFFKKAFIAYSISYFLSILFSIVPIQSVFLNTVKYFIQSFVILFIFQKALCTMEDIRIYIKTSLYVIVIFISLGIYESIYKDNPVLDYVFINAPLESIQGKLYYIPPFLSYTGELAHRFGLVRCYSFFKIHIEFGCACTILLFLYLFLLKYDKSIINKRTNIVLILILFLGVLLSNSKTPLVGLPFILLAIYEPKDFFNLKIISVFLLIIFLILSYAPGYLDNLFAIFNQNIADEGGGSSLAMRKKQFEIGLNLFSKSPLFGNGLGAISLFMKNVSNAELYGSESSWLKLLIERGIVGIFTYIYLYWSMFKNMKKYMPLRIVFFFLTSLIAMETATGFMSFTLYGSIIIVLCRKIELDRLNISKHS